MCCRRSCIVRSRLANAASRCLSASALCSETRRRSDTPVLHRDVEAIRLSYIAAKCKAVTFVNAMPARILQTPVRDVRRIVRHLLGILFVQMIRHIVAMVAMVAMVAKAFRDSRFVGNAPTRMSAAMPIALSRLLTDVHAASRSTI